MKIYTLKVKFATGWKVYRVSSDLAEITLITKISLENGLEVNIEISNDELF